MRSALSALSRRVVELEDKVKQKAAAQRKSEMPPPSSHTHTPSSHTSHAACTRSHILVNTQELTQFTAPLPLPPTALCANTDM